MDGFWQYSCSQLLMIFQKSNIASSLFFVPIREKNFNLKPAVQSDSASHLCNTIWILASGWEKIPVELSAPAHHLLPLTGDQQLVEERAVGPGEAIMLERWLRCRERLKLCGCRTHIVHIEKTCHREIVGFVIFIKPKLYFHWRRRIYDFDFERHLVPFQALALDQDRFWLAPPAAAEDRPGSQQSGAWANRKGPFRKYWWTKRATKEKLTSSEELEGSPGTQDMSGPWAHIQSRWCGSLGTWRSGAWLFPGRLGTWGLLPSFRWPPWEAPSLLLEHSSWMWVSGEKWFYLELDFWGLFHISHVNHFAVGLMNVAIR